MCNLLFANHCAKCSVQKSEYVRCFKREGFNLVSKFETLQAASPSLCLCLCIFFSWLLCVNVAAIALLNISRCLMSYKFAKFQENPFSLTIVIIITVCLCVWLINYESKAPDSPFLIVYPARSLLSLNNPLIHNQPNTNTNLKYKHKYKRKIQHRNTNLKI